MARKAKKPKVKRSHSTKTSATSPVLIKRVLDLEQRVGGLLFSFDAIDRRITRLEVGHSGDPAAHAALAGVEAEQPASDTEQPADAAEEQAS